MSVYKVLYNDVFDALSNISAIKTVQDFDNQYENDENFNAVIHPAVYLETGEVNWSKNLNNFLEYSTEPQSGIAEIKVHIVYHTLKGYDKNTKGEFFDIVDTVTNKLQKLKCFNNMNGTYTTLMRTNEIYDSPYKQLRVCVLTFESQLTDVFEQNDLISTGITFTIDTIVEDLSFGALKDVNGNILTDNTGDILYDQNGKEIIQVQKYF